MAESAVQLENRAFAGECLDATEQTVQRGGQEIWMRRITTSILLPFGLSIALPMQWQTLSAQPKNTLTTVPPVTSGQIESAFVQLEDARKKADWTKLERTLEQLVNLGPEKIPMIRQKIKDSKTSKSLKFHLVQAIYRTDGDQATDALLDISLNDPEPEIARMAGISINNRIIHKPIPEEQLNVLKGVVKVSVLSIDKFFDS